MLEWLQNPHTQPITDWIGSTFVFFLTNATTVAGFILALLIVRRVLVEKRTPSNFFAWFFIVVFFPLVGVPLYFMFGGRKSRKSARIKRKVAQAARSLTTDLEGSEPRPSAPLAYEGGNTATIGNHFELLPDGESTFHRLCHEIKTAEHTIHIATYILGKDETGTALLDLLTARAKEGVTVRLLLDSLGSWNHTRAARYKLRKAGGNVAMFLPVLPIQTQISSNLRNHRKIAIFDNYRAITGGQNLDTRFLGATPDPKRFVDFSVITQGPAVAHLTRTFLADWCFAAKESPSQHRDLLRYIPEEAGNSTIEVIASGPDIENDPLWEQIVRIIQEFKQQLTIITPYFIPDEVLFRSLIVKAHTGRQIRLILPLRSNHKIADIARFHYLRELDAAGVDILFYPKRMLHGKLILADGTVAVTGSANIDMRSLFVNFEIALLHYTAPDIEKLNTWAETIQAHCIPYETAIRNKQNIPSKSAEDLVHLLVPLL